MKNTRTVEEMVEEYQSELDKNSWLTLHHVREYTKSLNHHIDNVKAAGARLGVAQWQLDVHDMSKWSKAEFTQYAHKFFPDKSVVNAFVHEDFARAWVHHIHYNEHHWQHWMFPDGFTPQGTDIENGVMRMPNHFALEMVADWMGASKTYTGSWDMQKWLWKNMPRITLHSETAAYVREILDMLSYADTVYMQRFAHEPVSSFRQMDKEK